MRANPITLGDVLLRSPSGVLLRARRGAEDVLVDSRGGVPAWTPTAPPPALLSPTGATQLHDGPATVYADFAGAPLDEVLGDAPIPVVQAVALAAQLAEAVAWLHAQGRFHLELRPSQVLIDGSVVGLLGAGQALRSGREHQDGALSHISDSDLPYLAPEQTGRVGRPVDNRTDFYGIGALLYRMLSGQPPAAGEDRLQIVHAIIAVPPRRIQAPPAVWHIVQRLLSKDALDRYQSATALSADLERAWACLRKGEPVTLAPHAGSGTGHLVLPDGLYGRDDEIAALHAAATETRTQGNRLVLVSGPAGCGKSALVDTLRAQDLHRIQGKLDPSDMERPYAAVGRALDGALVGWLTAPERALGAVRERISEALGDDQGVLTPLLPHLESMMGPAPRPVAVDPSAAQRRLTRCLVGLMDAVRSHASGTALVLDDLQWADVTTFELLSAFIDGVPDLLVVGAYRPEEVTADHPIHALAARHSTTALSLGPMPQRAVRAFVAAALQATEPAVQTLADALAGRTRGNPFALRWSLRELHRKGLLAAGPDGGFAVDAQATAHLRIADNIAPLIAARIGELDQAAQLVLQAAALVGTWIDATLLADALDQPTDTVLDALGEAMAAELVEIQRSGNDRRHRFAHDRTREAALATLDPGERQRLLLAVGRALATRSGVGSFEVCALLNPVRDQLTGDERSALTRRNLDAAALALEAHGLASAAQHAAVAWELLGEAPWSHAPELALRCRNIQAEVHYQRGEAADAERVAKEVISEAASPADAAHGYDTLLGVLAQGQRVSESLDWCYAKIEAMGEDLPRHPHMGHVMVELLRTMWDLRGHDKEALLAQPETNDPRRVAFLRTLSQAGTVVEAAEQYLNMTLRAVRRTVRDGPARYSGFAYSSYGAILCGPIGKLEEGDRFGQLGLAMVERFGAKDVENRVMINYYAFVAHWTHPWRESIAGLETARRSALAAGDVTYLPGATMFVTQFRLLTGVPLAEVRASVVVYAKELEANIHNHKRMQAYLALVDTLSAPTGAPMDTRFAGLAVEDDLLTTATLHTLRGMGALHLGNWSDARRAFDLALPAIDALFGLPLMAAFKFYDAVVSAQAATQATGAERRRLRARARGHRKFLAPRAEVAPFNLAHRIALIDAELARVDGDDDKAALHYAAAADLAQDHRFANDAALTWICSAQFHQDAGRSSLARTHRRQAREHLDTWGAHAASKALPGDGHDQERSAGSDVDVDAVVRAGVAIGAELHLDPLLQTLSGLLRQSAGAQRVAIVVRKARGTWQVEAVEDEERLSRPGLPLEEAGDLLCLPAARFGMRTGQLLRVDDALAHPQFKDTAYVQAVGARSILVLPVAKNRRVTGLIYLEHRMMRGAFDARGVRVAGLLASQIGVSLDNARLFEDAESLRQSFERFVPKRMLQALGTQEIRDVGLGDSVEGEMTVVFSDIRAFTQLSSSLTPGQTFQFINTYLGRMEPIITRHGGFIDKYIGDAIMAVFRTADDGVRAGRAMLAELASYNVERQKAGKQEIRIGIGVHTGPLMLGTVGGATRMEGTVVGDTVNLASRVEGQTKIEQVSMLITAETHDAMRNRDQLQLRPLGERLVRGRAVPVVLYAVDT